MPIVSLHIVAECPVEVVTGNANVIDVVSCSFDGKKSNVLVRVDRKSALQLVRSVSFDSFLYSANIIDDDGCTALYKASHKQREAKKIVSTIKESYNASRARQGFLKSLKTNDFISI